MHHFSKVLGCFDSWLGYICPILSHCPMYCNLAGSYCMAISSSMYLCEVLYSNWCVTQLECKWRSYVATMYLWRLYNSCSAHFWQLYIGPIVRRVLIPLLNVWWPLTAYKTFNERPLKTGSMKTCHHVRKIKTGCVYIVMGDQWERDALHILMNENCGLL